MHGNNGKTTKTSSLTSAASNGQPIKLTFSSGFPPTNPRELVNISWINKIHNETKTRVQITPLYKTNVLDADKNGEIIKWRGWQSIFKISDIAAFSAVIPGTPLPISLSVKYFVYGTDIPGVRYVFQGLWGKFPELRAEYSGIKRLWTHPEPEFWVMSKKPVRKLDDFKGLKLFGIMGEYSELIGKLGATLAPAGFGNLGRNNTDGFIFINDMLMNFIDILPYSTNLHICNPPLDTFAMSREIWSNLPPDIQKVFDDSVPWLESELDKVIMEADRQTIDLAKAQGHEFIELSDEDLNKVFGLMEEVAINKANELDAKGLPGTKIFRETRRLIKEYTNR